MDSNSISAYQQNLDLFNKQEYKYCMKIQKAKRQFIEWKIRLTALKIPHFIIYMHINITQYNNSPYAMPLLCIQVKTSFQKGD